MERILYVDLDGVLVDFIGGWMDHYFIMNRKPVTKWNFGEDYGLDRKDFYKSITSLPISFWSNLNPTTWAFELIDRLSEAMGSFGCDKIMFLSHSVSEDCRIGKQLWVNKHFPQLGDALITVSDSRLKANFANENCTLIDDKFQNCRDFAQAGGSSFLFARPWNRGMPCEQDARIYFSFSKPLMNVDAYISETVLWEAALEPVNPTIKKRISLIEAIMKGKL